MYLRQIKTKKQSFRIMKQVGGNALWDILGDGGGDGDGRGGGGGVAS